MQTPQPGQTLRVTLPRLHDAQSRVAQEARRYNVVDCGRRFGKTTLGINLLTEPLLAGLPVAWFSPTYRMMTEVWRAVKQIFAPVTRDKSEQEYRLELLTGGTLELWSLTDPEASRGRKYARTVIDEAAKVRRLEEAWNEVIRATLADLRGGAWFLSTPKGLNYFYRLFRLAETEPTWARWQFATAANPYIHGEEIEAMRRDLPERVFRQEIMAEFVEDGGYFQGVDAACRITQPDQPEAHAGHALFLGADWALSNDFTVLTVGCQTCGRIVDWERFNQIEFRYQRERLVSLADRWHVEGVLPERNSIGEPNIEMLRDRLPILRGPDGKPGFLTTATTKPALIQALANGLEHDGLAAPTAYAEELRSFEVETGAGGYPRFSAPDGMHDDCVMSLALTWWAMTRATSGAAWTRWAAASLPAAEDRHE
jgi:hypothetical protein